MSLVAENIHEKFQTSVRSIKELEPQKRSAQALAIIHAEERKIKALEEFVRMSLDEYTAARNIKIKCRNWKRYRRF